MSPYRFSTNSILMFLVAHAGNLPGNLSLFRVRHANLPPSCHPTGQLLVPLNSLSDVFLTCSEHPYYDSRALSLSFPLSLGLMSKKYFHLASSLVFFL